VFALVLDGNNRREPILKILQDLPRPVGAPVVYDHDFVRYFAKAELDCEVFHCGGDASRFIAGRDHDAEEFEFG
jgi:hypothetical protein